MRKSRLYVVSKSSGKRVFNLVPNMIIGRSTRANIQCSDPKVSRVHATVKYIDGKATIEELASQNGVFVNDKKVMKCVLLDGDEVMIGDTVFIYKKSGEKLGIKNV